MDRVTLLKPDACWDRMLAPQYPVYGVFGGLILLPFKVYTRRIHEYMQCRTDVTDAVSV